MSPRLISAVLTESNTLRPDYDFNEGRRIADTSIMPRVATGNTQRPAPSLANTCAIGSAASTASKLDRPHGQA